jgi:hypothetical protein
MRIGNMPNSELPGCIRPTHQQQLISLLLVALRRHCQLVHCLLLAPRSCFSCCDSLLQRLHNFSKKV